MEDHGILVVDDSIVTLQLMENLFIVAGLKGCCAQSGEEALALLASRRFHLLVTDWQMPGMNGLELAERARKISPGLPIVLTTAGSFPAEEDLAVAGISTVLPKPFKMRSFLDLIRQTDTGFRESAWKESFPRISEPE